MPEKAATRARRGSVTVKAAWIGGACVIAAALIGGLFVLLAQGSGGQTVTADEGSTAVGVQGEGHQISIGGTTIQAASTWSSTERRELSLTLSDIASIVRGQRWGDLRPYMPDETVEFQTSIGIEFPQLVMEALGLNSEHNNLSREPTDLPSMEQLSQITDIEFQGVDSSRSNNARVHGYVTLNDGSRRDIELELELIDGRFMFAMALG